MNPIKNSRRINLDRIMGQTITEWMELFAASIRASEERLMELDRSIGDGDHGVNMRRGMNAVVAKLSELRVVDVSGQLRTVSMTMTANTGGASGPLYGAFFLQSSHFTIHKPDLTLADLTAAVEAGYRGVTNLGKAVVGDKTMVDALAAAVASLRGSCVRHESLPDAMEACRRATNEAALGTIPMVARKGRASYLGERSAGVQDPGAASTSLLIDALAQAVASLSQRQHSNSNSQQPVLL